MAVCRSAALGAMIVVLAMAKPAPAQTPAPPLDPPPNAASTFPDTPALEAQAMSTVPAGGSATRSDGDPPPLTLDNFFSAGWDEDFTRRSSEDRAPDFALLRVQTNFMEREVRINYFFQDNIASKSRKAIDNLDYFIAYGFNRRFMLEVFGNEDWIDGRGETPVMSGPDAQFVGRVQLISTADSSYTFNFRVIAPQTWLGQHQTTFSYGSAGFEDLTRYGLYRVALYGSFLFDTLEGPGTAGATRTDVQYDVSLAKTLTKPDTPLIGNFTVFLENFAQTNVDGTLAGRTLVTLTPGVRFNLGKIPGLKMGIDNSILFGVDLPVSGPVPWTAAYRFTYIKNF